MEKDGHSVRDAQRVIDRVLARHQSPARNTGLAVTAMQ